MKVVDRGGRLGAVDGAGVQAEDVQGLGRAVGDPGGGAQRAAQLAHDAGGRQAVADDVADGDRDAVAAGRSTRSYQSPHTFSAPTAGR